MFGLFATVILGYAAVIQFGLQFSLTQARYFFPMIAPAAVLLMVGLREIVPARGRGYAQVGVVAGLVALNIYIFALRDSLLVCDRHAQKVRVDLMESS